MRRPRQLVIGGEWMRLLVPAFAFAFVVLVDQVAKAAAFHSPAQGLIPAWNPGFLLGVGAGPRAMLVVLSAAAVLVFVALVGRWSVQIGVPAIIPAVIAGGMLSNTLDRVRFGSVRDFLYAPPLIINLADVAVAGGILLLAVAVVWRLTELHRARQTIAFDSRRLRAVVVARD